MRYITIPADVQVRPPRMAPDQTATAMSFRTYFFGVWADDKRATLSGETFSLVKLRRWSKVLDAMDACKPGDVVPLDDEDWGTLKTIVEAPQLSMPPTVAAQCLALSDAVLDAPDKVPT